jgi:hypothetical protein
MTFGNELIERNGHFPGITRHAGGPQHDEIAIDRPNAAYHCHRPAIRAI